eukprot:IDg5800t1
MEISFTATPPQRALFAHEEGLEVGAMLHNMFLGYYLELLPHDVVAFASYKNVLNESLNAAESTDKLYCFDAFDFLGLLRTAFYRALTRSNIQASFRQSGIWPLCPAALLNVRLPASVNSPVQLLSVEQLVSLLEVKRSAVRKEILGEEAFQVASEYIETQKKAVLTSDAAIRLVTEKSARDAEKRHSDTSQEN